MAPLLWFNGDMHPHEIEEMEMQLAPRMWDATPGVCCAYFQTGACSHKPEPETYTEEPF